MHIILNLFEDHFYIKLAKIITSEFFAVFQQSTLHVLKTDSAYYKPTSPKKTQKHSVDGSIPYSQNELNLLLGKFPNF